MLVFDHLYADQYDQFYVDKNYQAECDLIEKAIERHAQRPVKHILDVGCGTGAHALELAARDYRLTGVDLSRHMLDRAREKAKTLPESQMPIFVEGNAKDFSTGNTHDAAIMMFAVIGYLTRNEDIIQALRNIRSHIAEGGLFICDFWYGPSVLSIRPTDRVRLFSNAEKRTIRTASTRLDIVHHCADVTFNIWTLENQTLVGEVQEVHRMRYYFPQEFKLFLEMAGFEMCSISAFPSLDTDLSDECWNALVVARAI